MKYHIAINFSELPKYIEMLSNEKLKFQGYDLSQKFHKAMIKILNKFNLATKYQGYKFLLLQINEFINNSVDAITMRRLIDDSLSRAIIELEIEDSREGLKITLTDNGIGLSQVSRVHNQMMPLKQFLMIPKVTNKSSDRNRITIGGNGIGLFAMNKLFSEHQTVIHIGQASNHSSGTQISFKMK